MEKHKITETDNLVKEEADFNQINQLYDECLKYLKTAQSNYKDPVEQAKTNSFTEEKLMTDVKFSRNKDEERPNGDRPEPQCETIKEVPKKAIEKTKSFIYEKPKVDFKLETERKPKENGMKAKPKNAVKTENIRLQNIENDVKSERLRRLSNQLPRIIITQSNTSLDMKKDGKVDMKINIKANNDRGRTRGFIA